MLYAIARELAAALGAQGVPFPIVFGPEPTASLSSARERIVIEEPRNEKGDQVLAPIATHGNPPMPWRASDAARVRIFARSNVIGAAWHDHSERARQVRDHVVVELDAIVKGRRNTMTWGKSGPVELEDEKGALVWSGAVYELDLAIDRGLFRRTWAGDAREEVVIGEDVSIASTTKVSEATGAAGTPPIDAEIASGG